MNCLEFERRLEQLIGEELPEAARREAEEHVESCPGCREIESMARASMKMGDLPDPSGLTRQVLARTSGPACAKVHELLGDYVEGDLDTVETDLMRSHLAHCGGCRTLEETLEWIREALPDMAEIDPGPGFTSEVLRATVGRRRPGIIERMREWATGLVWRPRFALEGAYVGAAILWLLFGAGFSPFRDVPPRALQLAATNPGPVIEASLSSIPGLVVRPVSRGWEAWQAATTSLAAAVEQDRLLSMTRSLGWNGARMIVELLRGNVEESSKHLQGMITDLKALWYELSGQENNQMNLKEA